MRLSVGEREVHRLTGGDAELTNGRQIFAPEHCVRLQNQHVRPCDGAQASTLDPGHPWHSASVIGANYKFHAHRHPALQARNPTDHVGVCPAQRHEIGQQHSAFRRHEAGFEYQGIGAIGAARLDDIGCRRYQPPAVLGAAQQGSETGGAVETWPAQPVERTVAPDQCSRLAISNQRVILDPGGHGCVRF